MLHPAPLMPWKSHKHLLETRAASCGRKNTQKNEIRQDGNSKLNNHHVTSLKPLYHWSTYSILYRSLHSVSAATSVYS